MDYNTNAIKVNLHEIQLSVKNDKKVGGYIGEQVMKKWCEQVEETWKWAHFQQIFMFGWTILLG